MRFGRHLAQLRIERHMSQSQLAIEAQYDHSYISRLEADKREPSRDTIYALSMTLQLSALERDRLLHAAGYWPDTDAAAVAIALSHATRDELIRALCATVKGA